jgi:hypothetical protein
MPGTGGVPGDAVTLRAENARLRMLLRIRTRRSRR